MSSVSENTKKIKGDEERPSCEYCFTTVVSARLVDEYTENWKNESEGGTCAKCHEACCKACFENIRRIGETTIFYTCQRCGLKTCLDCQIEVSLLATRFYCAKHKKIFVKSSKYESAHEKCEIKVMETMNRILECPICPADVFKPIAVVNGDGKQEEFKTMAKRKALELENTESDSEESDST